MTKTIRKSTVILLTFTWLAALLLLTGCEQALIDNGMHRAECEAYLNAMLEGDFDAAHAITPAIDQEEHRAYFEENCKIIEGATAYTLTQTGWNINTHNGVTTKTAAYQLVTDNGVTCQFTLQSTEGYEGISHVSFRDSTAFMESTRSFDTVNIVLTILSLAAIAFNIWMLVDCIKRKMTKKVWWVILVLLTFNIGFSIGGSSIHTQFSPGLFFSLTSLEAVIPNETITLTIAIPLGALIYCFRRKKISAKYAQQQATQEELPTVPLSVAELSATEMASTEYAATDAASAPLPSPSSDACEDSKTESADSQ